MRVGAEVEEAQAEVDAQVQEAEAEVGPENVNADLPTKIMVPAMMVITVTRVPSTILVDRRHGNRCNLMICD